MKKACSDCKEEFPDTKEYFYINSSNGKTNKRCKECHKIKVNKRPTLPPPEEARKLRKEYYSKNRSTILTRTKKYHKQNKTRMKRYYAKYYQEHKDEHMQRIRKRRALTVSAEGSFTEKEFVQIYKAYKSRCAYCGKKVPYTKVHRDHVIPLSRGGTNYISNIVPACEKCNKSKGNSLTWVPNRPG